jgi:fatty acid-binding protein DegV
VKPILTIEDGEVVPLKRVRGGRARALEELRAIRAAHGRRAEPPRRHRPRRRAERMEAVRQLVAEARPQAVIDVATTLGAVVGTHAGGHGRLLLVRRP